ncbi:MAG: hypothetical protein DCC58_03470 [Chloroflexi bacterium]|nr:MAG: hypothetical protein DCC58_03470 [Chloroflexota bacterium]
MGGERHVAAHAFGCGCPLCAAVNAATLLTAAIAVATILAVLTRPRGISEGVWAVTGGALMVATLRITPREALATLADLSGVLVFLVGLFWLTLAAGRAGLFERAALLSVRAAGGDGRRLLAAVFAFGTLTTALLSNDATVVLVTPVVLVACRTLRLPPLPYLFACTFVADTASSLLPVSNPINLLYAERFDIAFQRHVALLALPTVLAVVVNAAIFHMLFRADLPRRFDPTPLLAKATAPLTRAERSIAIGLGLVALGYIGSAGVGLAPYWVTLAGGAALALVGIVGGKVTAADLWRVQPPSLYAFVIGLAIVVAAADGAGLLDALGRAVTRATSVGELIGLFGVAFGTALGTNVVNNWTMALAVIPPLERSGASELLIVGSMLGADIGPNFSVVGSLATLIWLTEIRREGLAVSARTYLRLGVIATLPALAVALIALYLLHMALG